MDTQRAQRAKTDGPTQCIAAKAVIIHQGRVLLLQQSAEAAVSGALRFHVPGGIVEPGEDLQEALIREVQEETGLTVAIGELVAFEQWNADIRGEQCQFFGAFYSCTLVGDEAVSLDQESHGYAWVPEQELGNFDILEPTRTIVGKAFRHN